MSAGTYAFPVQRLGSTNPTFRANESVFIPSPSLINMNTSPMSLELVILGHSFRYQNVGPGGPVPRSSAPLETRYDTIGQWALDYVFELIRMQMLFVENHLCQDPKGASHTVW